MDRPVQDAADAVRATAEQALAMLQQIAATHWWQFLTASAATEFDDPKHQ